MPIDPAILAAPVALAKHITAGAAGAPVAIPIQLEMLAVITSSIGGAMAAREKHLDLMGSLGLAVITALGGGLIRDVIMQVGDVYILNQPLALPVSLGVAAAVFALPQLLKNQDQLIAILDIFSVGLYSAGGADKAMVYGLEPSVCIMMGFFTGVGGGMLRDICTGQTPYIFQRGNLYAMTSVAGAAAYIAGVEFFGMWNIAALVVCVAVTMGLRWLSLRFNIMSPTEVDLTPVAKPIKHVARAAKTAAPGKPGSAKK